MSSRVQEEFYLCFNSSPPPDARVSFIDEEAKDNGENKDNPKEDSGALPKGKIHVRGTGTNQFGTFEILGAYDIETGVLSCQRIYVVTADALADGKKNEEEKEKEKEKEKVVRESPSRKPMKRSYFTRKRPVASWRTTSYGAYDDIYDNGTGRSSSGRKRQRAVSEPSAKSMNTLNVESSGPQKISDPSLQRALSTTTADTSSSGMRLIEKTDDKTLAEIGSGSPSPTRRQSSPPKSSSSRKPRSLPLSSARSSSPTKSSAYQIKIPKTGNPLDARWRSAHFLYFQRHVENQESPSTSNSPVSNTTTNYVVYEGEMNYGRNIRDGRGVCLYNNGTLYEGEWKKNKEHGNGILLTGDRKRIIYSGEWERGKMVSFYCQHCVTKLCDHPFLNSSNIFLLNHLAWKRHLLLPHVCKQ